ncbi:MAG: cytochrome c [Xanthobacteraceae bacterium]
MKRNILPVVFLAGAALIPPLAFAKDLSALRSVDVTLPDSTRALPPGPGQATAQNNCLACHSAGMIMTQPRMPKAAWAAEVTKMRNVYKAPVDEKDVPAIVEYLAAVKGPK